MEKILEREKQKTKRIEEKKRKKERRIKHILLGRKEEMKKKFRKGKPKNKKN
jgi:hypothetical protein